MEPEQPPPQQQHYRRFGFYVKKYIVYDGHGEDEYELDTEYDYVTVSEYTERCGNITVGEYVEQNRVLPSLGIESGSLYSLSLDLNGNHFVGSAMPLRAILEDDDLPRLCHPPTRSETPCPYIQVIPVKQLWYRYTPVTAAKRLLQSEPQALTKKRKQTHMNK